VGSDLVDIVDANDYLGTGLSLTKAMECEVDHRVSRAWCKFGSFRSELLNKKSNLYDRVRLFDSVVTPCALFGCGSWALTKIEENKIKVAQRRMLRAILGKGRRRQENLDSSQTIDSSDDGAELPELPESEVLESWSDWLLRTTHEALQVLEKVGAQDWVTFLRKQKWRWAQKVLKHSDARWTVKILHWVPDEGLRNVGHPKLRWRDTLQNFAAGLTGASDTTDAWQYLLLNKEEADDALPHFLKYCDAALCF